MQNKTIKEFQEETLMKKRYAIVGVSHRALRLIIEPVIDKYGSSAELVAYVDISQERMDMMNKLKGTEIPCYLADRYEAMLDEVRPDVVVVASVDATHHTYVIGALERDIDVLCEKPLTIDAEKVRAILLAEKKSKGRVTVTFNYRYIPHSTKIRELMAEGRVGKVINLDMNYYLDTYHGSSFFMRWNRRRDMSGGLCTHKCSHHFDAVRWWIDQKPVEVFAYGGRSYYGPNGPRNPSRKDGRVCPLCDERRKCAYYMRWHREEWRGGVSKGHDDDHVGGVQSLDHYKNHNARKCIYDSEIDIEDHYNAVIKFDRGAILNYSLNASVPYEGYRLGINGLDGRLETEFLEFRQGVRPPIGLRNGQITVMELFGATTTIEPMIAKGNHSGGDPLMQDEFFNGPDPDVSVSRMAPLADGALAVLTGIAMRESIDTGKPVKIRDLLGEELSRDILGVNPY